MRAQETRPVRSADPPLSPRANELLEQELRDSLGAADRVDAGQRELQRPHAEITRRRSRSALQRHRRGTPAGESTLSIATLAILTGAAVITFLVVVSFVFDGI